MRRLGYRFVSPVTRCQYYRISNTNPHLQLAALHALGLPIAAVSHVALSIFPPGGLYSRPISPSNVLVTDRHAWDAPLKAPRWVGMSGTHLPQVQPSRDALLVADVRCLTEPRVATSAKSQGWAVMPLFLGGAIASGVYRLPMYAGPPTKDVLQQITAECSAEARGWAGGIELLLKRKALKLVEGASVTVYLLDAQRFGEWDVEQVKGGNSGGRGRGWGGGGGEGCPPYSQRDLCAAPPLALFLSPPTCPLPRPPVASAARRRLFSQGRQGETYVSQARENAQAARVATCRGSVAS